MKTLKKLSKKARSGCELSGYDVEKVKEAYEQRIVRYYRA